MVEEMRETEGTKMEIYSPPSACIYVGNLRGDNLKYETSAVTVKMD